MSHRKAKRLRKLEQKFDVTIENKFDDENKFNDIDDDIDDFGTFGEFGDFVAAKSKKHFKSEMPQY